MTKFAQPCPNDPNCINHRYCGKSSNGQNACLCKDIFYESITSNCSAASGMFLCFDLLWNKIKV